jgi:hypothetical protein
MKVGLYRVSEKCAKKINTLICNIIRVPCSKMIFNVYSTTAQQLDTKVYNHIEGVLHVSASFGHLQGGI